MARIGFINSRLRAALDYSGGMNSTPRPLRLSALLLIALGGATVLSFSGCVSRGYKLADKSVPPPVALNLVSTLAANAAEAPPFAEATLQSVIAFRGPGSWKSEAYWDEYVVTIVNRSESPLVVTAVNLHSDKNEAVAPGTDPWALEKLSKKWWETNTAQQTGTYIALGAGTVASGVIAATAYAAAAPATFGGTVTAVGAGGAIGLAGALVLPVVAGTSVVMNVKRKHQVEAEFDRRRLALPLSLVSGQTAQGSLFFRITPGPRRLIFTCVAGTAAPRDVTIDLTRLAGLHLKPDAVAATPANGARIQP